MGRYFGTDGFRGQANVTLTADHAYKIGRFVGWYFNSQNIDQKCRVVIGKDTRLSSYMLEYALAAGLTASGSDAYLMHVTTTASVSYITCREKFNCGIMITASHNAFCDNGIKILNCHGEKIDEDFIEQLENYLDGQLEIDGVKFADLPFATGENIGRTVDYVEGRNKYVNFLTSLCAGRFDGVCVGLDCANGASWEIAQTVFETLGAQIHVINASPNGLNINKNAGSTHIEYLQKFVVEQKLDVGFAFDGDADRCLCVDEKGNVVDGDGILYVCAKDMLAKGQLGENAVVTTVMSNIGLHKAFDKLGIESCKTPVGDKYVYECMRKNGYVLGGEQSGHVIFGKEENTGDGIVTALKMLEIMVEQNKKLSDLVADLKIYPQTLVNVPVVNKDAVVQNEKLKQIVQKQNDILGNNGRVLVRASGTEEVVRIMVEAESLELCESITRIVKDAIGA